jgi:dipeptidyl aminopeptidase/acylaminoacyl peptidase
MKLIDDHTKTTVSDLDVPLIPRRVLFGNPEKFVPRISPDGTQLAYLAPVEGELNLWIQTIGKGDERSLTQQTGSHINTYFWSFNGRYILFTRDLAGNENFHLYQLSIETGEIQDLTPFDEVQVQLLKRSAQRPDHILIGLNKRDVRFHDAYLLNVNSGKLALVAQNPGNIKQWVADMQLIVKTAVATHQNGDFELLVKRDTNEWTSLLTWQEEDTLTSAPIGFIQDSNQLYLYDSRDDETTRLVQTNVETGEIKVIAADLQYDVSSVLINPHSGCLEAVAIQRDRLRWKALSSTVSDDLAFLAELERGDFRVVSRDLADKLWVVGYSADNAPISYYAYDRLQKSATFLFHHQPILAQQPLAEMQPFSFQARDGLHLHGYITFPPHLEPRKLPMVLTVHGGPWSRNKWGFDPEAQWLSNRGYICLQVNYRGSTGYGKSFLNAGNREWGGAMQNDLIDAVHWAIDQGYADPDRIAIYGGSYGGYAALVGAAFTPDLFCCAVDVVGPMNLVTLIQSLPPYWESIRNVFYRRVGNPETEAEFLLARSPISRADQIKVPLLIVQGANDPRVKVSESEQMVAALKKHGISHEYMLFPDEGHGFTNPKNRLAFYAAAERFLAEHLNGRFQPSTPN